MQKFQFVSILILIFIFQGKIMSQNIRVSRNIVWNEALKEPNVPIGLTDKKTQIYNYFRFNKADYNQRKDFLPIYYEIIGLNFENYLVKVTDMQFVVLSDNESKLINESNIANNIEFEHKLMFQRKLPYLAFTIFPYKRNVQTGKLYKLTKFTLVIDKKDGKRKYSKNKKVYSSSSVLSSGSWFKIKISESGIYKISFDELRNLGISSPEKVRIFGNGGAMLSYYNDGTQVDDLQEIDILFEDSYILFYGDGLTQWTYDDINKLFNQELNLYSDYTYYFLSSDYNSGKDNHIKTQQQSANTVTKTINTFDDFAYHEINTSNLIKSGRLWVGELFDLQTEYSFNFNFPNLLTGSPLRLSTSLLARSPVSSSFSVNIAGIAQPVIVLHPVSYDYEKLYAAHKKNLLISTSPATDDVSINIKYNKGSASSVAWLDYINLNVQRELKFSGSQMPFRSISSVGVGETSEFILSRADASVKIWEITDSGRPKIVQVNQNGSNKIFRLNTDSLRTFVAYNGNTYLSATLEGDDVGLIPNQNLHGIAQTDMLIVCYPKFLSNAEELRKIHEDNDKLNVTLVSTEQIYNEFSSGAPDVSAIRDFLKMLYDRATNPNEITQYLLLFGDGSYDNKTKSAENSNYILTYQSENSLHPTQSFVTDDFFGLLDDGEGGSDGLLDIGIGRIPVTNETEANTAVEKIKMYLNIQSFGDWRNKLCFIADDEDNGLHMNQADELSKIVKNNYPVFNIDKIYLDAYQQESSSVGQRYPDVNQAISEHITKGTLLINYTGHGGEDGLAEERIVTIDQINKWVNPYKLPVFMTATCEFSRYDNYERTTAGEYVFLNPNGGAVALFTTTRLVYASPNFTLNKNFYQYIFEDNPISLERYCLGDVMRLTKNATAGNNKRNFSLLGDPALKLSYGMQDIITTSITKNSESEQTDTLNAFDKVTIKGEVINSNGQINNQFNGILYPSIFDKFKTIKTLDNDGEGSFEYLLQNNKLFKGKASISNGKFSFSFIIPKDIRYNIDTGKISYYAKHETTKIDAYGFNKNILIGGASGNDNNDQAGPLIKMYLNDESFVSGGITNNNPAILAFVQDENGINTTGNGIGHDIVAIIDDDINQQFNLNDFYESEIDSYTKGSINYQLNELSEGEHKLRLKVWDIYNNSSEDSLFFTVINDTEFSISHVLNYPNPFTSNTSFFFEHNRPNQNLKVLIQVFSVSGKVVKTIHYELNSEGFRSEGIPWDGRDDFGNRIGRGVYFYKITVQTNTKERAEHFEKLLIF